MRTIVGFLIAGAAGCVLVVGAWGLFRHVRNAQETQLAQESDLQRRKQEEERQWQLVEERKRQQELEARQQLEREQEQEAERRRLEEQRRNAEKRRRREESDRREMLRKQAEKAEQERRLEVLKRRINDPSRIPTFFEVAWGDSPAVVKHLLGATPYEAQKTPNLYELSYQKKIGSLDFFCTYYFYSQKLIAVECFYSSEEYADGQDVLNRLNVINDALESKYGKAEFSGVDKFKNWKYTSAQSIIFTRFSPSLNGKWVVKITYEISTGEYQTAMAEKKAIERAQYEKRRDEAAKGL